MKVVDVEWDRFNLAHFQEHGRCTQAQVEQVLLSTRYPARAFVPKVPKGSEARVVVLGRTAAGRSLKVIAAPRADGVLRPVTCWPMTEKEKEIYEAWRKSRPR